MMILLAFVIGAASSFFVVESEKDKKIQAYEEYLEIDGTEDLYLHEDPTGRVFAMGEGICVQIY